MNYQDIAKHGIILFGLMAVCILPIWIIISFLQRKGAFGDKPKPDPKIAETLAKVAKLTREVEQLKRELRDANIRANNHSMPFPVHTNWQSFSNSNSVSCITHGEENTK